MNIFIYLIFAYLCTISLSVSYLAVAACKQASSKKLQQEEEKAKPL